MSASSLPERFYRALLRTAPTGFREAHGADLAELFGDLYSEALRTGGVPAALSLWLRSTRSLIVCVFAEYWEGARRERPDRGMGRGKAGTGGPDHPEGPRVGRPRNPLDPLRQDLRFALRSFLRRPGLTAAAILILGVGIGATTTIYSVVDTVMLRPLPYPDPGKLVYLGAGIRPLRYVEWWDNLESYDALGAATSGPVDLTGDGPPQQLQSSRVTPDLLPLLGATPHLGRLLMREDYQGDGTVAVLGFGHWQTSWGGDPDIIGRQIRVGGQPLVVAGVLSPEFEPPAYITGERVDIWLPLDVDEEEIQSWSILRVVGRLREGVGLGGAQAELNTLHVRMAEEYPGIMVRSDGSIRHLRILPLHIATVRGVSGALVLLTGAVWLMLLIACANVANLLLAHGTARAREIALRGALGASRGRIVGQLLTESVALAVAGGVLGVGVAYLGVAAFLRFNPGGVPRIEDLAVDPRILLFALLASVVTGIIFGVFPALQASRKSAGDALKEGGSGATPSRRGRRIRNGLVVTEIALALILLTGAGLFFRSLMRVAEVDPGFEIEDLVTVPLTLGDHYSTAQRQQFTREVADRIGALRGTEAVASGLTVPFQYVGASKCCMWQEVRGENVGREVEPLSMVMVHPVTPDFFRALGTQMAYGREFRREDDAGDGMTVVINEPLARHFFGTEDAVGRSVYLQGWEAAFTVVGVVPGVHHWGIYQGTEPGVYVSYSHWGAFSTHYHLMVRSSTEVEALTPLIRDAIRSAAPDLPVEEIIPMRTRVDASVAGQRFLSILLGTFAAVALILATGGIYASMLYTVGQRRQEMGIRLAMGARSQQVVGLVLRSGLTVTAMGIGFGLAGSLAVALVLRSWLYGISATDPTTLIGVALILAGAALLACLVPAWMASRSDPLETLKAE
ncbi:ABC transporter permease [Gemmatimonadota bacterium]